MNTRSAVFLCVAGQVLFATFSAPALRAAITEARTDKVDPPPRHPHTASPHPDIKQITAPFPEIGESLKSLTSRYGEGLKNAFKIRIPGNDQYYWEVNSIGMNVVFHDGKAVMIVAHRVGGLITKNDITQLLKANSDIHGWVEDVDSPRWLRRDKKVDAFREKGHEDMFFVRDLAQTTALGVTLTPGSR